MKWLKVRLKRMRVFKRLAQIEHLLLHHANLLSSLNPCALCGSVTRTDHLETLMSGDEAVPVCGNCRHRAKSLGLKTRGQWRMEQERAAKKAARHLAAAGGAEG